jgi:signal recognition particle GTPase
LALAHVDELLNVVKQDFVKQFAALLTTQKRLTAADVARFDYTAQFADIERAVEDVRSPSSATASDGARPKAPRRFEDTEKGQKIGKSKSPSTAPSPVATPDGKKPAVDAAAEADADDAGLSDAERRAREVQRNIERMRAKRAAAAAGSGKSTPVRSPPPAAPANDSKKPRGWDYGSPKDAASLDIAGSSSGGGGERDAAAEEAKIAQMRAELRVGEQFDLDFEVESDAAATAAAEASSQSSGGGLWSYFRKLTVGAPLTSADLTPVLEKFRNHLVAKNVASEIADKLCASVSATLVGKTIGTFASLTNEVRDCMDEAMTRILTPKRNIDILRDARAAKRERRPYSIVFVGVNGVGKCLARDTPVLMFDGSVKAVQDVRVGDRVMGDDSNERRVLSLTHGREQMARITTAAGDAFSCNFSHVLSLRCAATVSGVEQRSDGSWCAHWHTAARVSEHDSVVCGVAKHEAPPLPSLRAASAFLARMSAQADVCAPGSIVDISVRDFLSLPAATREHFCAFHATLDFAHGRVSAPPAAVGFVLASGDAVAAARQFGGSAAELAALCGSGAGVPQVYKVNDRESRRALLRGLVAGGRRSARGVELPSEQLARDATFVARSIGVAAVRCGTAVRIESSLVAAAGGGQRTTPMQVTPLGVGEYFGFALDGNHRFVLGESLLVTHNSTSLAKVSSWLQQNKLSIMIAACDTFRSGAVEQLRVHSRCIGVELFERGYNKDAAAVAQDAVAEAHAKGVDVVVIDTAGRMQDNEPLMRSLAKLVSRNQPDLILFVGEALVGNEAVDQVVKFNDALKTFAPTPSEARQIDGIILTKFDTIDDKVGAAVSMAYTVGAPVVFVGTGQHYTDLKTLNVRAIVRALLK